MKRKEVMVMIRKIIHIDENRCNGCGLCAAACHEGAIAMINGKAKLIRDDYCDGLGDCLPACPTGAIEIKEREAIPYNEEAVKENKKAHVCPGSMAKALNRNEYVREGKNVESALRNWPVQIKLAPFSAPYYKNADLLIAADCTAYSYGSFHDDFIAGKTVLIGCPKLDGVNYADKLKEIIKALKLLNNSSIENISLDFISGLPLNDKLQTKKDIIKALDILPKTKHISLYYLELTKSLEEKWRDYLPKEEESVKYYEISSNTLKDLGFIRYEISNYAINNYESIHNSNYWKLKNYLGLGASAVGYYNSERYENIKSIKDYIENVLLL